MAQRKPVSEAEQVIIRNIDELKKTIPKGKLLIHLTKEQWADLNKGMKSSKVPPERGIVFRYAPLPDGSGGLGSPECVAQVCELCSVRLGRGPDGSVGMQCRCRPDPSPECREHPVGGGTGSSSLETPMASTANRVIWRGVSTIPISLAPLPYLRNTS